MIPLYKPFMSKNIENLNEILYSGKLAYGHWGVKLENKIKNFLKVDNFGLVSSYNYAVLIVLNTLNIKDGDEVIASPMSCLASNQPLVTSNCNIIWADIDPSTGTLDPNSVKKKITKKTKAIFHNHHCGYPGYINEINALGKKNGIFIVDDAIEAFGSKYNSKMIGNTGADATVFSFQTVRLPNTIDGGGFTFKDKNHYNKALLKRDLGVNRNTFRDKNGEISLKSDVTTSGYGATLNEVCSYLGFQQMKNISELLDIQKSNAKKWKEILNNELPEIKIQHTINLSDPNYWVFGIFTENKNKTIEKFRLKGFHASGVHIPNNTYSLFNNDINLHGVKEYYNKFLAIPSGWWNIL